MRFVRGWLTRASRIPQWLGRCWRIATVPVTVPVRQVVRRIMYIMELAADSSSNVNVCWLVQETVARQQSYMSCVIILRGYGVTRARLLRKCHRCVFVIICFGRCICVVDDCGFQNHARLNSLCWCRLYGYVASRLGGIESAESPSREDIIVFDVAGDSKCIYVCLYKM